ncbi:MAG: TIGR04133 family radical SAM/SPASM protein [Candidatus Aegiribacteria sp.]|nr:TIGR04133 family radical SAM/SPASM protein [Candidatus Aegiribacteria sp.]
MNLRPGLKKRTQLELFRLYRNIQTRIHDLTYLFWECTLRCNLNCRHCGSDCLSSSSVADMPAEDFLHVLDEVRRKLDPGKITVALTGGEPILRKDLEPVGSRIAGWGFPWGIVSNGWELSGNRLNSLLNSGMVTATVSLDGMAGSHDWLRRRKGSFKRAVKAISNLAASSIPVFDVVTCLTQRNLDELDQMKNQLIKIGVKNWRLISIFPRGRAAFNPELSLDGAQLRQVLEFIRSVRTSGEIRVNYGCDGFLGAYEKEVRDDFMFCHAGISIGSVLIDGSISACPSLREDFIQGNIYKDDFLECWEKRFQVMRDRRWAKTGICAECSSWRWCSGNGLHLRHEKSGELMMCQLASLQDAEFE